MYLSVLNSKYSSHVTPLQNRGRLLSVLDAKNLRILTADEEEQLEEGLEIDVEDVEFEDEVSDVILYVKSINTFTYLYGSI